MLITEREKLEHFYASHRMWQGVPGIERTRGGRTFITLYSGGVSEQAGNFAIVLKSDNDRDFGEPIAAAFKEGSFRCFDSTLWIDPLGRLWFIWNVAPGEECFGAICENPDADELKWSKEFYIGRGVMLNKPTVLSSGEWLFPIALWNFTIRPWDRMQYIRVGEAPRSNVYKTVDNGKTFTLLGGAEVKGTNFDEHSIVELDGGRLMMAVRTDYGTGISYSYDRGKNWSRGERSSFGSCVSRIHIRRLKSGRILRISHDSPGRTNLTAFLSEDNGKTYPYKLLLDDRKNVSYPDATEASDGYIYIVYDRERGNNMGSLENSYACAREILTAKITEEDILLSGIKSEGFLRNVVSKLDKLAEGDENPYASYRGNIRDVAEYCLKAEGDVISKVFEFHHPINCESYRNGDGKKLDELITRFKESGSCDIELLVKIITVLRSRPKENQDFNPLIESIKAYVEEHYAEDFSVLDIADSLNTSVYYMVHLFKDRTATTIIEYRTERRLMEAKCLLVNTDKTISEIAHSCGFGASSYFTEIFVRSEKITPTEYRKYHKK